MSLGETYIRCSVHVGPRQTYAPLVHCPQPDGGETLCPLRMRNEYDLSPTWTDFYKGDRKVARLYTHYYSHGKDLHENPLPELLWVHPERDSDTESDEYAGA